MPIDTFPSDILDHVFAFLTIADLMRLVRPLSRSLEERAVLELEKKVGKPLRCYMHPCVVSRVELAMPAVVKAITFDSVTNRLFVCTLGDKPNECVLYEHLPFELPEAQSWVFTERHKGRQMQRIALPTDSVDFASFEGPFLVCKSKSDESVMFDCRNRVLVDLPMGHTGLFASVSGRRMAAYCGTTIVVFISPLFHDEISDDDREECDFRSSPLSSVVTSKSYETYRTLASVPTSPTMSDDARSYESGPVTLVPSFKTPFEDAIKSLITDIFLIAIETKHEQNTGLRLKWLHCSLAEATGRTSGCAREHDFPSSIQHIGAMHAVTDTRIVMVEAYFSHTLICDLDSRGEVVLRAIKLSMRHMARCISVSTLCSQSSFVRGSTDETICCVGVVGNKSQILIMSCDGSLIRKVDAPHTALVACHPAEPIIISTNDEESLPDHLLLQALEGGYGSLIQFDPSQKPATSSWKRLAQTFQTGGGGAPQSDRLSVALIFCYAAVSLALVWTTFALIYNGWWLYMQKLVFVLG